MSTNDSNRIDYLEREIDLRIRESQLLAQRLTETQGKLEKFINITIISIIIIAFSFVFGLKFSSASKDHVKAKQITITDEQFRDRITLKTSDSGYPIISFYDSNNNNVLNIYSWNGSSGISAYDSKKIKRFDVMFNEKENMYGMFTFDSAGHRRTSVGVGDDGWTGMSIFDQGGKLRISNSIRSEGSVGLTVFDSRGQRRAELGVGADDLTGLGLHDSNGRVRIANTIKGDNTAFIQVFDDNGLPLFINGK